MELLVCKYEQALPKCTYIVETTYVGSLLLTPYFKYTIRYFQHVLSFKSLKTVNGLGRILYYVHNNYRESEKIIVLSLRNYILMIGTVFLSHPKTFLFKYLLLLKMHNSYKGGAME